jgi:hypothetical protein
VDAATNKTAGDKLGPYETLSAIGAGGMDEMARAKYRGSLIRAIDFPQSFWKAE